MLRALNLNLNKITGQTVYIERVPDPAGHHAVSCEVFIGKGCLYSNDRFVDSILSMIDLMRVNFKRVK